MRKLLLALMVLNLTACATGQTPEDEPGFWTKLRRGTGKVLSGMGSGLQHANYQQQQSCLSTVNGQQVYTTCN